MRSRTIGGGSIGPFGSVKMSSVSPAIGQAQQIRDTTLHARLTQISSRRNACTFRLLPDNHVVFAISGIRVGI